MTDLGCEKEWKDGRPAYETPALPEQEEYCKPVGLYHLHVHGYGNLMNPALPWLRPGAAFLHAQKYRCHRRHYYAKRDCINTHTV